MSEIDFLVGETVVDVRETERLVFAYARPEADLYADLGPSVTLGPQGEVLPMSDLVGRTVAATSTAGGSLRLTFTDGSTVRCDPSDEYEAWEVSGGKPYFLVVCTPGGGVAVFDERDSIDLDQLSDRDPDAAAALDQMLEQFDMPRPTGFPPANSDQA
jgi:Family of unknown function (DUF6188)